MPDRTPCSHTSSSATIATLCTGHQTRREMRPASAAVTPAARPAHSATTPRVTGSGPVRRPHGHEHARPADAGVSVRREHHDVQHGEDEREDRQAHVRPDPHGRARPAPARAVRVRQREPEEDEPDQQQVRRDAGGAAEDPGRHPVADHGRDGDADAPAGDGGAPGDEQNEPEAYADGAQDRRVTRHGTPARPRRAASRGSRRRDPSGRPRARRARGRRPRRGSRPGRRRTAPCSRPRRAPGRTRRR